MSNHKGAFPKYRNIIELHVEERKLVIKVLDHKGYKPPNQVPDEQAGRVFTYKFGEVRFNDGWHWMESILTRAEHHVALLLPLAGYLEAMNRGYCG